MLVLFDLSFFCQNSVALPRFRGLKVRFAHNCNDIFSRIIRYSFDCFDSAQNFMCFLPVAIQIGLEPSSKDVKEFLYYTLKIKLFFLHH